MIKCISMPKQYSYFNGKTVPLSQIKINPYDIGFSRGYGVFDVMCTKNGKPFLLPEHFSRLKRSAELLNLKVPFDEEKYKKIVNKLLKLNNFKESGIRTMITGGLSPDAFSVGKETVIVLIEKFKPLPPVLFEKGAKAITLDFKRSNPRAKITNYVEAIKNQEKKKKAGALEILYIKDGKVFEFSTSNVFVVKKGKIKTPKEGVLFGITRDLTIKLAEKAGFEVVEKEISEKELFSADEVILTATNKDIVPIVEIDGRKIGEGKPGKITTKLMDSFSSFTKNY